MLTSKFGSISLLMAAEVAAMSLWFVSAAILPDLLREAAVEPLRQAALSSSVQIGFVAGALISAFLGLSDRFDPRKVFALSAVSAGIANLSLLAVEPGGLLSIMARFATGALLAGVYPVGMKIAVGWGQHDRGLLVGSLVGALTLGSALPHLVSLGGGAEWRYTVAFTSIIAIIGGLSCMLIALGPHHRPSPAFDPRVIATAWTNKRVRLAYLGYFGHMWELFVMWAWIATATAASYQVSLTKADAEWLSKVTAFLAIALGAVTSVIAGWVADRIGKAELTIIAMAVSGLSAIAAGLTFGGSPLLTFLIVMVWGMAIIPDSAQFSALVADASPPSEAGSLMTFQTALGFLLTFFTVQAAPVLAVEFGWPTILGCLALGPFAGIFAMLRLRTLQ